MDWRWAAQQKRSRMQKWKSKRQSNWIGQFRLIYLYINRNRNASQSIISSKLAIGKLNITKSVSECERKKVLRHIRFKCNGHSIGSNEIGNNSNQSIFSMSWNRLNIISLAWIAIDAGKKERLLFKRYKYINKTARSKNHSSKRLFH